ncbi:MAG: thiamine-phosphate kinase [Promethearchaeota archaeon]|jgi:thiamine-monophosphate kinase
MNADPQIGNLGEIKLIKLIEDIIIEITGKALRSDDSFFFDLRDKGSENTLVLNSDMLVHGTDVPPQMNLYQVGRKSVIMNLSDLIVKGVKPKGIIISLGLPKKLKKKEFIELLKGIVECANKFDLDYIGGDINETREIIINPTVFGFKNPPRIIYRNGIKIGDKLVINNKFGLTGVGFDILLNKRKKIEDFPNYRRSIMSVLKPEISELEAFILSERGYATSSIDSSDGLSKSLKDLMISNPDLGFEIYFNDNLIDPEAKEYSQEFSIQLENLVLNGGEEFIHLFTIDSKDFHEAKKLIQKKGGKIFDIGTVISEESIIIEKESKRSELKSYGFEHFSKQN